MMINWKDYYLCDMVRHCFWQAMVTPVMELSLHYLKFAYEFKTLHWQGNLLTVPARDIVAEI